MVEGNGDWKTEHLPADLQDSPVLKDIPDIPTLAKNLVDSQAYIGQSIRIPGEDAAPETVKEFHEKLTSKVPGLMPTPDWDDPQAVEAFHVRAGKPEKAEEYKIPEVDSKGMTMDNSTAEVFRGVAHKYGLSQKQFAGVVKDISEANIQSQLGVHEAHKEKQTALKGEWGAAYDTRLSMAKVFAEKSGAPKGVIEAMEKGLLDSESVKYFYHLAKQIGVEGKEIASQGDGAPDITPDEAALKISEIYNNKEHPYWNPADPGHEAAKKHVGNLYKMKVPQGTGNHQGFTAGSGGVKFG